MSIHGIRRIKDDRVALPAFNSMQLALHAEKMSIGKVSKNQENSIQLERTNKAQQKIQGFTDTQFKAGPYHRKTGSLGFSTHREKEYLNIPNQRLMIQDFPIHVLKKQQKLSPYPPFLSSRQRQLNSVAERTKSRLDSQRITRNISVADNKNRKSNFILEHVVGKGGFGKVWKVREKKTNQIYAMKVMLKSKVIMKKSVNSVMNERELLAKLNHPFLINMNYAFQDRENIYLVMDYVNGGDLRYHIGNKRKFAEPQSKFFIACIIASLQYLHMNNVIHRDLKPENLVFDSQGYLKLTDLGVSREYRLNNGDDTSGTPGYMAPEVICKTDHSFPADYFALGVICYEMMLGKRPYVGKNRKEIRQQIIAKQVKVDDAPYGYTPEAVDFINKLIQRRPEQRLGYNGINQIKNHAWFKNFDWNSLLKRTMKAPYRPLTIQEDYDNFKECISEDSVIENEEELNLMLRDQEIQRLFEGYQYDSQKKLKSSSISNSITEVDSVTFRKKSRS